MARLEERPRASKRELRNAYVRCRHRLHEVKKAPPGDAARAKASRLISAMYLYKRGDNSIDVLEMMCRVAGRGRG